MDPASALAMLTNAVSLLQGIASLTQAYDQVSAIIAKRIAEGRKDWTQGERAAITSALLAARASAVAEVDKLPPTE